MRPLVRTLLLAALVLATASAAWATNCLQRVGEPYEKGNQVCIKVKNTCAHTVGINWKVDTYNFGVQGSGPQSTDSGTNAIPPGATIEICSDKPANSGKYCFRFEIENFDQTKPGDGFYRWLNNIQVAMAGGYGLGNFEVGGSGFVSDDLVLAVDAPRGWSMNLSTTYVAASDFPATIDYTITGPERESAQIVVTAYSTRTGEAVGDATFSIGTDADAQPIDADEQPADTNGSVSTVDDGEIGDVNEVPIGETPPSPALSFGGEDTIGAAEGVTLLMAWDESGDSTASPTATFEVFGDSGWEVIADQGEQIDGYDLGVALTLWDTSALPAGTHQVRVTMTNQDGKVGTAQRSILVVKSPEAVSTGKSEGKGTFTFDAGSSFDQDGTIVDYRWDLGDGTIAYGPTVTHVYPDPKGSYPVNVTVTDDFGLETTAYCLADASDATYACEVRSCGCAKMEIRGAGTQSGIPFPPYVGGGNNNGPQSPPNGGAGPLNYKFEVLAELVPGSDPAKCTYQQWAKGSHSLNGVPGHKNHDGVDYPRNGDAYGEDGPHSDFADSDGNANPPTIRWIDAPGFPRLRRPGSTASMSAAFFAMVSGPLGTCSCTWEVDMALAANGAVTGPTLTNVNCSP